MIVTMNLNPSIIRRVTVDDLSTVDINHIDEHEISFIGSPVHSGHVIKLMQGEVLSLGFTGGTGGRHMKAYLNSDKIDADLTWLDQEMQTKFEIVNNKTNDTITLLDKGLEVDHLALRTVRQKFKASIIDATVTLFSGTLPANMPKDDIKELLDIAYNREKKYILALKVGYILELLEYRPYCLFLDKEDLKLVDIATENIDEAVQQLYELMKKNKIHYVFLNLGINGLISISKNKACYVKYDYMVDSSWNYSVKDAMLGMLSISLERGYEQEKITKLVFGAAVATIKTDKPYLCNRKNIDFFSRRVKLEEFMNGSKGFLKIKQK